MDFSLYPDQEIFQNDIRAKYRQGIRRIVGQAVTGFGKSRTTAAALASTSMSALILVHREGLRDMTSRSLTVPHGLYEAGKRAPRDRIAVGTMQTVSRRLGDMPQYQWIVSDEVHLAMCPTWMSILNYYKDAWHLGLSATPTRLDGKGLGDFYQDMVCGPSMQELMDLGRLVRCRSFSPPAPTDSIKKTAGEFSMSAAAGVSAVLVGLGVALVVFGLARIRTLDLQQRMTPNDTSEPAILVAHIGAAVFIGAGAVLLVLGIR